MFEERLSRKERKDLNRILKKAEKKGAVSGGIFGGRLDTSRTQPSKDVDVFINNPEAPFFGEVFYKIGRRSGTLFHIFRKRPGVTEGASKREEILNFAERTGLVLFKKE